MSQKQQILAHFRRNQTLTALEALKKYGCLRLAARVYELRSEGHNIAAIDWTTHDGKVVALYWLSQLPTKKPR